MDMFIKVDKCMFMKNEGCLIIGYVNNYDIKDFNWFDKLCDE